MTTSIPAPGTAPATTVALLRSATAPDHAQVDTLFGAIDLGDPAGYAGFLRAHARALGAVEGWLAAQPGLPDWRPRLPLVAQDLAALGESTPPPLAFAPGDDPGTAWGVLYVIEGSRLGNTLLSRAVGAGRPVAYLGAWHLAGEWRALLQAIDAEGAARGEAWSAAAVAGARATFALYRAAA